MKVYTTKEVAEILRISKSSVIKLIHQEKLHAKKIARKWRIPEKSIKMFLESKN